MPRDLDTIVELQQALNQLREAKTLFEEGPEAVRTLGEEHRESSGEIEALELRGQEAEKRRRSAESEVEDAQVKLEHFQNQVQKVTTQREYGALLQEIDAVKSKIREQEDEALQALEEQEQADKELAELQGTFAELDERYQTEMRSWQLEKPSVGKSIEQLEGRIEVYRERLPRPVLAHFERLFERHQGEPLAPISEVDTGSGPQIRHCSKCNHRIRPQIVVEIQNAGALVPCDSCQRILFIPDLA